MTPEAILNRLRDLGVTVVVDGQKLRLRPASRIPVEVRAGINEHRNEIVAEFRAQQSAVDTEPMPADPRARAVWLGRLARSAGIDAQALFDLIDATLGPRVLGPYELDAAEAEHIATLLRAEVGKRPPLVPPAEIIGDPEADDTPPASIIRKNEVGMTEARFAELCRRVLGRPGIQSTDDDAAVLTAMPWRARS